MKRLLIGGLIAGLVVAIPAAAGELTRRYERTLERVLYGAGPRYDAELLTADVIPNPVRRFTSFSGDLSGRYLGALAASGRPAPAPTLLPRLLEHQRPDGRFGDPLSPSGANADDMARLWGAGRMLIGLVELHQASGSPQALQAARKLGDWLVAHGPRFNAESVRLEFYSGKLATGYICWTQNIEGLVALAQAVDDDRYLALARELAERTERRPGQHSHGWLTSMRGILALARATGEQRWIEQVEREWDQLTASGNLLPGGGLPEYFAPGILRDEGCSQADWVRLNLALWQATGKARYVDAAESGLLNALYPNQLPGGGFGHVTYSARGFAAGRTEAWWCCTLHGLRTFAEIERLAFRVDGDTIYYGLAVDAKVQTGRISLHAETGVAEIGPASNKLAVLTVVDGGGGAVSIAIRNSRTWNSAPQILVNGEPASSVERGDYWILNREWKEGDRISIHYEPRMSFEDGIVRLGSRILGVAEAASPELFNEPYDPGSMHLEDVRLEDGRKHGQSVQAMYRAQGFPEQENTVTLLPLADRFELAESPGAAGLRWRYLFGESVNPVPEVERRQASPLFFVASAAALAAALGFLGGLWFRRRRV